MEFLPKGCLWLTTAVDQLAEARRSAGQTNDDAQNAARAELREELHSGPITAAVVCPTSGKIHIILRSRWACKEAPTWLEQGEFLLKEVLGDPPSSLINVEKRVKIFIIRQHDFQRLLAKQEVKHESVPPHDPLQPPKPMSQADVNKKFDDWRKSRGDNIPSAKEDIKYMKQYGVSRDRVREMRKRPSVKLLPSSGKRGLA